MQHHRKSQRWTGFDYRHNGAYFVTICVHQSHRRKNMFGRVVEQAVRLNRYGIVVREEWQEIAVKRPQVELDTWIIMPDHVHGIVFLHSSAEWDGDTLTHARPDSLSAVIGAFKAAVSRKINQMREQETLIWQRGFHDRVIRNRNELEAFRRYIVENPARWDTNNEP